MEFLLGSKLISFLALNSIFAFLVFLLIWPLQRFLVKNNLKWKQIALILVLIRLFLPIENNLGFNPLDILSSSFEAEVSMLSFGNNYFPGIESGGLENEKSFTQFVWTVENTILTLWLVGVVLTFLLFVRLRNKFKKIIKNSIPIDNQTILNSVKNWKKQFRISRSVEIKISKSSSIPFTIGIFNPQIVIPITIVSKFSPTQMESIIAHEMAHIKRYDDLQLLILAIIQSIYFFNPFVWFVVKKLGHLRERQCDSLVLQRGLISKREYGLSLLKTMSSQLKPGLLFVVAMSDKKSNIKKRLNTIKGDIFMKPKFDPIMYLIFIFITIVSMSMSNPSNSTNHIVPHNEGVLNSVLIKPVEFQNPLKDYKITSNFGPQIHPITKTERHHDGIDLKASTGTKIFAAEAGTVLQAKLSGGHGKLVVISHIDGFNTRYSHLSEFRIKKGQKVKKGEVIGLVGNTGLSTAPHLHFEIRENDSPVNPKDYIKF